MIEEDLTANKLARCEAFSVLVDICRHLLERQPFLSSHQNSQIYVSALMRPFVAEKLDVSVAVPPSFLGRKRGTRAVAGAVAFDGGGSRQRGTDSRFLWVSFLFFAVSDQQESSAVPVTILRVFCLASTSFSVPSFRRRHVGPRHRPPAPNPPVDRPLRSINIIGNNCV